MNEVEDFLEHFGVKGMRWGFRSAKQPVALSPEAEKQNLQRSARRKAVAKKAAISGLAVGTIVLGAGIAATIMIKKGKLPSKTLPPKQFNIHVPKPSAPKPKFDIGGTKDAADMVRQSKMSKEAQDFIKQFKEKQTLINREANADLRRRDNELNVPIYKRTYLPEWT